MQPERVENDDEEGEGEEKDVAQLDKEVVPLLFC